jgi:hypothetical protein
VSDHDISIDEKRVYGDKAGKSEVFVASSVGVVVAEVSGDLVGGFGIRHRCEARDVAAADGRVAVATGEDVLLADASGGGGDAEFAETGFGPAVAVGLLDDELLAADESGRVARYDGAWTDLGTVDGPRAIDGPLVAAADGVYRVEADGLSHAGLDDVRDVAGAGIPLAATGDGLYALGNGWMDALDGAFDVVASDGGERAHAVTDDGDVYARSETEWGPSDLSTDERVADVDYGLGVTVAVTEAGTLLVEAGEGWRSQPLGLGGVGGLAVRNDGGQRKRV